MNRNQIQTKIVGLFTILLVLWIVFYFLPELLVSLFTSLLGNMLLFLSVLLVASVNRIYGVIGCVLVIVLYRFTNIEKFTTQSENDFLRIQHTINRQTVFDMDVLNTQASQEELDYFKKNGMWPWSNEVIELYKEAQTKNPYVRTVPDDAVNEARSIYNQAAILRILTYQSKEGQFLLNGVQVKGSYPEKEVLPSGFGTFPYDAELIGNYTNDIIKCNLSSSKENLPPMERISYTGKGGIFSEQTSVTSPVDYQQLESIIPGFTFLNDPCNPCGAMGKVPDYSCKYQLKLQREREQESPTTISSVWRYLWNLE
jgi:hypothetical protein